MTDTYSTVTCYYTHVIANTASSGVSGWVYLSLEYPRTDDVLDALITVAPAAVTFGDADNGQVFKGYMGDDGKMRRVGVDGTVGVPIIANDGKFGLERLVYRATFDLTTPAGTPIKRRPFLFAVEDGSTDINLNEASPWLGSKTIGEHRGPRAFNIDDLAIGVGGDLTFTREDGTSLPIVNVPSLALVVDESPIFGVSYSMTFGT